MRVIGFHNPDEENGFLSNWFLSEFSVDGVVFTSMEQYMMYQKAIYFNDREIAKQILSTKDVARIKELGRLVSGYHDNIWNGIKQTVVYEGLMAKFSQNDDLRKKLKGTEDAVPAECAVKKRLASVAGDIREHLRSLMGMWEEVPKANVIMKSLNKMLVIKDSLTLYQDFYQSIDKKDMFVLSEKNVLEWEDVFPFLYLMAAFEGVEENKSVKHLVIDEMQDYTPIQFAVLNKMYPCQKTILGDFGQVLHPCHLHSLDEIREINKDAEFVVLNKSYRSTYEIMEFDEVIIPDADHRTYHSEYDRNLLYIACTRAMHKLTLFYTESPSPFLPKQDTKIGGIL